MQLQGAIRALMAARGADAPAVIPGKEQQLRRRLDEERSNLRALQESQRRVDAEEAMRRGVHGGGGGFVPQDVEATPAAASEAEQIVICEHSRVTHAGPMDTDAPPSPAGGASAATAEGGRAAVGAQGAPRGAAAVSRGLTGTAPAGQKGRTLGTYALPSGLNVDLGFGPKTLPVPLPQPTGPSRLGSPIGTSYPRCWQL